MLHLGDFAFTDYLCANLLVLNFPNNELVTVRAMVPIILVTLTGDLRPANVAIIRYWWIE